jgi:outer membrane protein W
MKRFIGFAIAAGALVCATASTASAQEFERYGYLRQQVPAPSNAFEIGVGAGYTQGFGGIQNGLNVQQVANAGIAPELMLGWRASPRFEIGWAGQYQEFKADNDLTRGTNTRGLATNIEAQFHTAPFSRVDPWVGLGAGYRMLWIVPNGDNNNTLIHGFELAKLRIGADIRAADSVAIGPVVGADLNLFVWRNPEGATGNVEIADKKVNTFIFAGVQGRFDLGGTRVAAVPVVAKR